MSKMSKFEYLQHTLQEYYLTAQQDLEKSINDSEGHDTPSATLVLMHQVRLEVLEDVMEAMKTIEQFEEGALDTKVH